MRLFMLSIVLNIGLVAHGQSCQELIETVENNYYGTTYRSYNSTAISEVTFYEVRENYETYYFAIVCFKQKYGYGCNKYIYQVGSRTKFGYSLDYMSSAGEAFWEHIQPYADVLGCGARFQ